MLAALLSAAGCTSARKVAEEKKTMEPAVSVDERGFDPLELPRDTEILPLKYPKVGIITGRQVLVSADAPEPDQDTMQVFTGGFPETVDTLANQAYRVQILTSKLFTEARRAARVAEEIFDRPVFVDYEVPYFKVRVGSFESREKAESYQQKVRAVGYSNAWVVMVNIDVRRAARLYGEPFELPLVTDTASVDTGSQKNEEF